MCLPRRASALGQARVPCEQGRGARVERVGCGSLAAATQTGVSGCGQTCREAICVPGRARVGDASARCLARPSGAGVWDGAADGRSALLPRTTCRACAAIWLRIRSPQPAARQAPTGAERCRVPVVVFREGQTREGDAVGVGALPGDATLDCACVGQANSTDRLHDADAAAQASDLLRVASDPAVRGGSGRINDLAGVPRRGTHRARQSRQGTATRSVSKARRAPARRGSIKQSAPARRQPPGAGTGGTSHAGSE
jgi:hypothetical protein